ncbi:hypothetical protein [Thalassobacillus hwangdonensis]|uniref:DUF1049 domain-containing protein n=1 Tax=Thalassobacillus hwangdonensis TaxID=546108 RepID=A0ABW3L3E4_9BACI
MINFFILFGIGAGGLLLAIIGAVLAVKNRLKAPRKEMNERMQHLEKEIAALKEDKR